MNYKVITNFDHASDDGINTIALNIIAGCTENTDFVFVKNELINVVSYQTDYSAKLSVMPTAGIIETGYKNQAKAKLNDGLHTICLQINVQKEGNIAALQGSGAPLTKDSYQSKEGIIVAPKALKGVAGNKATELKVSIKKLEGLNDHGSMFAIHEALNAPDDINLWQMKYCTGHHLTITDLKPGFKYMVAAAFQGPSGTTLVFCSPITVWTKNG